eukprot:Amastigsp_a340643_24.p4 type:complete len:131 gc:universal Amastigsp_a340643_24:2081-1689(-)
MDARCGSVSRLFATWRILTRNNLDLNSALKTRRSAGARSRDLESRRRIFCSPVVRARMALRSPPTPFSDGCSAASMSATVSAGLSLKSSSTAACIDDTTSSCERSAKTPRTSAVPSAGCHARTRPACLFT